MRQCLVHRVPMKNPGDISSILELIESGELQKEQIVAIFGKTEGNGCVNDFTRSFATETIKASFISTSNEAAVLPALIMSGGCEGGISPHFVIFSVSEVSVDNNMSGSEKRLAIGAARTENFLPEEIGRIAQIRRTADAVLAAKESAGIESVDDIHFVQIKCPLLTSEKLSDANSRGAKVVTNNTYASMAFSRAASALGAGLSLGEIETTAISDEMICNDFDVWSGKASASAGIELEHSEVIVLGNSSEWTGGNIIAHSVMQDAIDIGSVWQAFFDAGLEEVPQLQNPRRERVKAVLAKADPPTDGRIREERHIMNDDSDINSTRHARALVGGVIASAVGRTDNFISGGAEHQGPDGGGPVAVIVTAK